MKNDKDFVNFGKVVAGKLKEELQPHEDNLDDEKLGMFMEELSLCLYKGMNWSNYYEVSKKLKTVKN